MIKLHSLLLLVFSFIIISESSNNININNNNNNNINNVIPGYDLPLFPSNINKAYNPTQEIPLQAWMTMKNPLNTSHLHKRTLRNNQDCEFHIMNDAQMNEFMETKFVGTSVLWAYRLINPRLMAAKADIWRIAVLWYNGGVYIDADSAVRVRFSTIIKKTDRFVFGTERNLYDRCYDANYRLNQTSSESFARKGQVINWLILAAPRHPFLSQMLYNLVDTIKHEYLGLAFLNDAARLHPIDRITCTTGPGLLTASMSEVLDGKSKLASVRAAMETETRKSLLRFTGVEFGTYNGQWRANNNILFGSPDEPMSFYTDQPHYYHILKNGGLLLKEYKLSSIK